MMTPALQQQLFALIDELLGVSASSVAPAAADASVREYWRVQLSDGRSIIAMHAEPAQFDVQPFLARQAELAAASLPVPAILGSDTTSGLVLLEDLGDQELAGVINAGNAQGWYRQAIDLLVQMQTTLPHGQLPVFDAAFQQREMEICREWYFSKQLAVELNDEALAAWQRSCALIVARNCQQPQVFMHRDFHARNLMVQGERLRLIDFQDAVAGPLSYDLVSLLRDAYLDWDEAFVLDLAIRYWEKARAAGLPVDADFADFYRAFEWQGLQRHLKILGLFARLKYRDGKERYQADIPRVLNYVMKVSERYVELGALTRLLRQLHPQQAAQVGYTF
ncbi:aminoglycoside phosphotransferase family protein [Chitinilyticum piscinae]|uniref:Phosphotransferase n=1 Tax=Chitinilyticum piscinae TaxID=2866724 RepID=A0A8J7FQR7_9NEIS|nr:phosphotransferase [Chitinilyticum piscinae]MBE9610574.1 phosphotransferase [Chitinilyticum piscinae]